MNRQQRRAMGIREPVEENKSVRVGSKGDVVYIELVGVTSNVATHAAMSPKMSLAVAFAFVKASYTAWTHFGKWKAIKSLFTRQS